MVVDPGDAQPVLDALQKMALQLDAILVTHHHPDHTGGVAELRQATAARVYGPALETMPEPITRCHGGSELAALGMTFSVIDVPGHTAGHLAYYASDLNGAPLLFCGDTIFSAGCGRLFEGTPAQMLASLDTLSALPDNTQVCCAHEYTLTCLEFAALVEPGNAAISHYQMRATAQRRQQQSTLPSTMLLERQVNPFLRTRQPAVRQAIQRFDPSAQSDVSVFAALRRWKDQS